MLETVPSRNSFGLFERDAATRRNFSVRRGKSSINPQVKRKRKQGGQLRNSVGEGRLFRPGGRQTRAAPGNW
jgi:hypothetical protein